MQICHVLGGVMHQVWNVFDAMPNQIKMVIKQYLFCPVG
jgi:hypothetical protein